MPVPKPRWESLPLRQKVEYSRGIKRRKLRLIYRYDPLAFTFDMIDWGDDSPADFQQEVLGEMYHRARIAVYGPHGLGKTMLHAISVIHFALTRDGTDDWKAATTAGVWRQLERYLWPEIHKWVGKLRWDKLGWTQFTEGKQLLVLALQLRTGQAFAVASNNPAQIEGVHGESVRYNYDESKIIPAATFNASEGAFSAAGAGRQEAFAFASSTPGPPAGRFHEICSRAPGYDDWWVRHVSKDEAIRAGRLSPDWAQGRAKQWGQDSSLYLNRVEGLFAADDEEGVIPLAWVEMAVERWKAFTDRGTALEVPRHLDVEHRWKMFTQANGDPGDLTHLGVDVADGGGDDTVLAPRHGLFFAPLRYFPTGDPMTTAHRAMGMLNANRKALAVVDGIGIGSGVVARLKEEGYRVEGFIASESAGNLKDRGDEFRFENKRAAAWWFAREALEPGYGVEYMLPPDDRLIGELVAPKQRPIAGGRIRVESKDDIRRRLDGKSTDAADAVVQAIFAEALRSIARSSMGRQRGREI
jgi:hypothetical protein